MKSILYLEDVCSYFRPRTREFILKMQEACLDTHINQFPFYSTYTYSAVRLSIRNRNFKTMKKFSEILMSLS